jgi:hypothetical protein
VLHSLNKKGNALVDLIIGMIIMGLVSISVVGAYTSLMSMASNAFRNSKASWMGNSVMEIYSAKAFDDIDTNDSFTLDDQFPGYTANVTVVEKDVDLSTNTIEDGDASSNYKEITAVISGLGVDDILTYKTLRSNCTQAGPYITGISTTWVSDYAKNGDNVVIKVTFNRKIDVANNDRIVLNLNVAERTGSQESYSVSLPATPINVTGGTLAGNRLDLSFTYTVGQDHTSSALDNYLDVSSIDLSGATITGFDGSSSDGCLAYLDLPISPAPTLADDQVIIRLIPGVYYIFHDWATLQNEINPVEPGGGMTAPVMSDIFDAWQRFDGGTLYANKAAASGNALKWKPQWTNGGNPPSFSLTQTPTHNVFDHFYMEANVEPPNGFISPNSYENFIFETTLSSTSTDDDMLGIIIAFAQGSDLCNNSDPTHDGTGCSSTGSNYYVLTAARSAGGAAPVSGWAILYGNPAGSGGGTNRYDWYHTMSRGRSYGHWSYEAPMFTTPSTDDDNEDNDEWYITEANVPNSPDSRWNQRFIRVNVQRSNNIITAKTTGWLSTRPDPDNTAYLGDSNILTVDLSQDRRLHKFIPARQFGYITFSQPFAKYLDNRTPPPPVAFSLVTDYIVYFHNRNSSENDGIYDTWDDFTLTSENEALERNIVEENKKSAIWQWDPVQNDWIFQPGLSIQELNGYYGIITPNPDEKSDPLIEDEKTTKYFIKQVAENGN